MLIHLKIKLTLQEATLTFHEEVLCEVENGAVAECELALFLHHVLASLAQSLHQLHDVNDAVTPVDLLNPRVDDTERARATNAVAETDVVGADGCTGEMNEGYSLGRLMKRQGGLLLNAFSIQSIAHPQYVIRLRSLFK